jgi:hypothetical protein
MAPRDIINRTIDAGRGVGQRSQDRIEGIVGQLQRMSEEQLDQVVALMGELRDRSMLSGEQVASAVDRRVREQFASLGLATKADVDRLEAKLDALTGDTPAKVAPGKSGTKKAVAAAGTAKKASAKKASAKKASSKKASPKTSAKGSGASRTAGSSATPRSTGGAASGSRSAG